MQIGNLESGRSQTYGAPAGRARRMTIMSCLLIVSALPGCSPPLTSPDAAIAAREIPTYTVPASIAADCSVDVTRQLQGWFATVPDTSIIRFGNVACYNVDSGLVIADRHGLTFDGNGSTFKVVSRGLGARSNWIIRAGSDITLKNMIARGANPNAGINPLAYDTKVEWQHAYTFQGTQTGTLDNVEGYDVYGDFVEAEPDYTRVKVWPGNPASNITVRNSHFERNGRMGIGLTHVDGFVLENSYLGDVRWSAVDLELDADQAVGRNIRIEGNKFGRVTHYMFVSVGGGSSQSVGNVTIRGNVMQVPLLNCYPAIGIGTGRTDRLWTGWTIENNTLLMLARVPAIIMTRTAAVTIKANNMTSSPWGGCDVRPDGTLVPFVAPIGLVDSHGGEITSNVTTGRYDAPYSADSLTTGFTFTGNVVH